MTTTSTMGHAISTPTSTSLRVWAERVLWMAWIPLVVFTVFFASIPDIHNGMHPVRHSTTVVQCH